jgi:hypothetical protein
VTSQGMVYRKNKNKNLMRKIKLKREYSVTIFSVFSGRNRQIWTHFGVCFKFGSHFKTSFKTSFRLVAI